MPRSPTQGTNVLSNISEVLSTRSDIRPNLRTFFWTILKPTDIMVPPEMRTSLACWEVSPHNGLDLTQAREWTMKRLAVFLFLIAAVPAFGQQPQDAEVITNGFQFKEEAGIMYINGEVKNNTSVPLKNFKVRVQYLRGTKVVYESMITCNPFDAKEQRKIVSRSESVPVRWNDYKLSFYEGTTPLTWRIPKQ